MLVRLRKEVEEMEGDVVLGLAEGMESLVVGRVAVVDMELGSVPESDLRSSAEEGTDFDSLPVVVRNSEPEDIVVEEDIVPGLEGDIVAGHKELVGGAEADLRNSRYST